MGKIVWNDSLNIGIKTIDEQHKKLFEFFNDFVKHLESDSTKEILLKVLKDMADYIDYHFTTEEEFFKKTGFSGTAKHIEQHDIFRKKVDSFFKHKNQHELQLSFEIILFLRDWIVSHIQGSDKEYVECFLENGIE